MGLKRLLNLNHGIGITSLNLIGRGQNIGGAGYGLGRLNGRAGVATKRNLYMKMKSGYQTVAVPCTIPQLWCG